MFGRQIFLESVSDQHDQRRRNELYRQLLGNQGHGTPITDLTNIPSPRNDGLTLDLNLIVVEDTDRLQPSDLYTRTQQTNCGHAPSRYFLDYIKQMEERYVAMEQELTRTKMLIPGIARNTAPVHETSQTGVNWEGCSLAKYGQPFGTPSGNRSTGPNVCEIRNQERINVSSRRKHHTARRSNDSIGRTLNDISWTERENPYQNLQGDMYPIKGPGERACRPRALNNNLTAVCSTHNVAVILPQDSTPLTDVSRHNRNDSKVNSDVHEAADKFDDVKIFGGPNKCLSPLRNEVSMEGCQRFDKSHEPETSRCIDLRVKHEDRTQANPAVNTPKFRPITQPEFGSDTAGPKLEAELRRSAADLEEKCLVKRLKFFENADARRKEDSQVNQAFQGNRSHWNNHFRRVPYERTRSVNNPSRNVERLIQRNVRGHKRAPTPRSNVHTSYTPMMQSAASNPMLDPNGFTIQLLRLAVLLYSPALMPALNSLIARQNVQTSIPIPCFEGSNDLLAQVFRILNSQQCIPNLPYAPSPRIDENSGSCTGPNLRDSFSSPEAHYQNLSNHIRNKPSTGSSSRNQQETSSIAVNTSLESCTCTNAKLLSSQCSESSLMEQGDEDAMGVYA
ncbi:uncharacterized protein LOC143368491 [Andrena cerasifolii]|uniref:uncharacterized protein LOC143368491 n=1 Tax=Andrena cerasifolii TaxID=2819439 RepID=UPI004037F2F7